MTLAARCKRLCRRLRADAVKGSAAIEFAMVAPVFFVLLMGTIEAGVMFFAQSTLAERRERHGAPGAHRPDRLLHHLRRQLRGDDPGAVPHPDLQRGFRPAAGLQRREPAVRRARPIPAAFPAPAIHSPLDGGGNLPALTVFNVGNACDVVLVRAFYKWPVFTPGLGFFLAKCRGRLSPAHHRGGLPQRALHHQHGRLHMMRGFRKDRSDGVAAVEFALLLPVMITLFFGVVETSLALVCRADVSQMAATAADLISQVNTATTRRHQQCLCGRRHHSLSLLFRRRDAANPPSASPAWSMTAPARRRPRPARWPGPAPRPAPAP